MVSAKCMLDKNIIYFLHVLKLYFLKKIKLFIGFCYFFTVYIGTSFNMFLYIYVLCTHLYTIILLTLFFFAFYIELSVYIYYLFIWHLELLGVLWPKKHTYITLHICVLHIHKNS